MKKATFLLVLVIVFFFFSCEEDEKNNDNQPLSIEKILGYVQKGPFINGTSIMVSELNEDLSQTGKTFSSQILDNKGSFELNDIELSSQYAEIKADGFYFNEITGEKSAAQLTLFAICDFADKSTVNVNILSHLEKGRIQYLISSGASFSVAKKQAQQEILNIFNMGKDDIQASEMLDISNAGDDNAILLAISLILQGFGSDADLTELLANFSTDIREDGVLNSSILGSDLINHAMLLQTDEIRQNLESRYQHLGVDATIPDFEKYIQMFCDSSEYEFTYNIEYPVNSDYGLNILHKDVYMVEGFKMDKYSMSASLPVGTNLKIVLKGGKWFYEALPDGPVNWDISKYDFDKEMQEFVVIEPGTNCDLKVHFHVDYEYYKNDSINNDTIPDPQMMTVYDTISVEYYENNALSPTKTKDIVVQQDVTIY